MGPQRRFRGPVSWLSRILDLAGASWQPSAYADLASFAAISDEG